MTSKTPKPNQPRTPRSGKRASDGDSNPSHPDSDANYKVGFGKPPKHTQFKPGKSGNPKGRLPQSRNMKTIVTKVLDEQVEIREAGRLRRMPKIEAIVRVLVSKVFKGDPKAMAALLVMLKQLGYGIDQAENPTESLPAADYDAIIAEFLGRAVLDGSDGDAISSDPNETSGLSEGVKA